MKTFEQNLCFMQHCIYTPVAYLLYYESWVVWWIHRTRCEMSQSCYCFAVIYCDVNPWISLGSCYVNCRLRMSDVGLKFIVQLVIGGMATSIEHVLEHNSRFRCHPKCFLSFMFSSFEYYTSLIIHVLSKTMYV